MNLYLIGMPAVGKTALGRALGARLGRPFVDLDRKIEAEAALSVPEIFAREGEAGFRARERRALEGLAAAPGLAITRPIAQVIALGGGAPLESANRARIKATGKAVWLTLSAERLASRIAKEPGLRPLLADCAGNLGLLIARLMELETQRSAAYSECADLKFPIQDQTAEELAATLLVKLGQTEG